ncbi:hypothetical protein HX866_11595 [Pseudomonas gingeri]|uniref:cyclophilin-like fold protein n=1 Tax=Pseudomonas gingeri TaxID=117681 RepID=UPI0015A33A50|nr:cyclophilin-like fold protein [Pseudomonas gingeri]NWA25540.1 hypothetical protein [Pseudomonas gingeri]NWD74460.1 hypothetical protein [Pseudomonas gingeri]
MKVRITVHGKSVLASPADNPTARDFASLLPITLSVNDLYGREKFAGLPGHFRRLGHDHPAMRWVM